MDKLKNKRLWLLLGFCLMISACQTLPTQNIDTNVEESTMQDKRKIIDSYHFFEKEGNLFFVLTLKNNTTEAIEISSGIKPFNVYRQNYESVESRYITPSPIPTADMILIAPNESHNFEYKVNDIYRLEEGKHDYDFIYFYNKNDDKDVYQRDYRDIIREDTILSFTWHQYPNSIKGKLISYDVKDK